MTSSRIRITVDVRLIDSGGVGTYILQILNALTLDNRFDITLLGDKDLIAKAGFRSSKYLKIIEFKHRIFSLKEQVSFLNSIPKDSDLFWSPQYNIPLFTSVPIVVTIHDLLHLKVLLPDFGFIKRQVSKFFFYRCSVKASLIVFNSFFTKNEFLSIFPNQANRSIVTYLGVDRQLFNNNSVDNAEIMNSRYFVMIGNIKPHKNFDFAIRGFLEFSSTQNCKLVIIGRHENFITTSKSTLNLIEQNRDKIIFLGKVTNLELVKYLKSSVALIFPSIYEGFGLPTLEAMSSGVPIVASNIPTTVEICGRELPFYFELNDKEGFVNQLSNVFRLSTAELELLKNKMYDHSKKFSWHKCSNIMINNLIKLYEKR